MQITLWRNKKEKEPERVKILTPSGKKEVKLSCKITIFCKSARYVQVSPKKPLSENFVRRI